MNTQSHVLLGAAIFTRRAMPARNIAAVVGSLVPDIPLYLFFLSMRVAGYSNSEIFRDLYWQEPMPSIMGASHSFVIFGALFLIGLVLWRRQEGATRIFAPVEGRPARFGEVLTIFAAAVLLHAAADFLLHHDDAHSQFWPVSTWKFRSPVSYWDPAHYGSYWSAVEALIGIACAVILWRRFTAFWVRVLCALAIIMYVAVPVYFVMSIADHQM